MSYYWDLKTFPLWNPMVTSGFLDPGVPIICPSLCPGLQSQGSVQESRAAEEGLDHQLVLAVVGSISATCLTTLLALVALVCIRRSCVRRRRTFTYQSGSVSDPHPQVHKHCPQCACISAYTQVLVLRVCAHVFVSQV